MHTFIFLHLMNTWKKITVGGWWWGKVGSEPVAICRWHGAGCGQQEVEEVGGLVW